jgi:hypothetical protein
VVHLQSGMFDLFCGVCTVDTWSRGMPHVGNGQKLSTFWDHVTAHCATNKPMGGNPACRPNGSRSNKMFRSLLHVSGSVE